MRQHVTVGYGAKDNVMFVPAMMEPYPEPVRDVSKVVLNAFTTNGNADRRAFVPERTCERVWYGPTRNYVCSLCGAGLPKGADRYVYMNYCSHCGARITRDESKGQGEI